ncbi:helix-turn-helix domain-containing protein [Paracoccus sp. (in: a-proteobacteria)]|uniref:helix-turn-helix domain-containing protein n=1 Tax=Paracoccus sp. TaxID=267 RepID=UPI00289F134B|nr:helix-turn-helix domain-containing protein [Paracoccus sp. (in: a-proteobacteria)]
MSHKVVTLVCSRIVGSAAQKAVLVNMADKASDGGEGVFCAKATIVSETELSRATVFRAIDQLVERGLIKEVGQRPCLNGHTVIYDLNMDAIAALPEWKKTSAKVIPVSQRDPSHHETGISVRPDPSHHETGTRLTVRPKPSLEPSLNIGGGGSACARETDPTWREQMLQAMGVGPDGIVGPSRFIGSVADMATAAQWEDSLKLDRPTIIAVLTETIAGKRDGPPKSFRYFTPAMQRTAAELQAPPLQPTEIEGPRHERPIASDRRQAAADDRHRRIIIAAATARSPSGPAF